MLSIFEVDKTSGQYRVTGWVVSAAICVVIWAGVIKLLVGWFG